MGFFDHLQRKSVTAIKPQGAQIRTVEAKPPAAPAPAAADTTGHTHPRRNAPSTPTSPSSRPRSRPHINRSTSHRATAAATATASGSGTGTPQHYSSSSPRDGLAIRSSSSAASINNGVRKHSTAAAAAGQSRSTSSRQYDDSLPSPRIHGLKKHTSSASAFASAKQRSASAAVVGGNSNSNSTSNGSYFASGYSNINRTSSAPSINNNGYTNGNSHSHSALAAGGSSAARTRKRQSLYDQRLSSDSSDDDGSSDVDMALEMRKRTKMSVSVEPDFKRQIKMVAAFEEEEEEEGEAADDGGEEGSASASAALRRLKFVHAVDITPADEFDATFVGGDEGSPAGGAATTAAGTATTTTTTTSSNGHKPSKQSTTTSSSWTRVDLQYPSICPRETFPLVLPHDDDGFKPIDDIVRTIEAVSENYIPPAHLPAFDDPTNGLKRRLRRALAHSSKPAFCAALADYNALITSLRTRGIISAHLDGTHSLPLSLVERILTQIYARTVSPRVETLRRYENGSDNVYGELLPRFVTEIFKQTRLRSGQVFVDLGSGVGNVVLQAALEVGCESWGCEVMSNACALAELQQKEFGARCALWGVASGEVHLVRGDFLKQESIIEVLRRADVVLINNQAFTPQLNDKITNLFLEMKEGVQIVSLKGFVPAGHKITARNFNSPINLLSVKKFEYWSEYVSWTDAGGDYFIATKDSQHLRRFAERM